MENEAQMLAKHMELKRLGDWSQKDLAREVHKIAERLETAAALDADGLPCSAFMGLRVEHIVSFHEANDGHPPAINQLGVRAHLTEPTCSLTLFINTLEEIVQASTPWMCSEEASIGGRAAAYIASMYEIKPRTTKIRVVANEQK